MATFRLDIDEAERFTAYVLDRFEILVLRVDDGAFCTASHDTIMNDLKECRWGVRSPFLFLCVRDGGVVMMFHKYEDDSDIIINNPPEDVAATFDLRDASWYRGSSRPLPHPNTARDFWTATNRETFLALVRHLQQCDSPHLTSRSWWVGGTTYCSRQVIDAIPRSLSVDIEINRSMRRGAYWFLLLPLGRQFLFKVHDSNCFEALVSALDRHLSIYFLSFSAELEQDFLSEMESSTEVISWESIKNDKGHLILGSDLDAHDDLGGAVARVSFGVDIPGNITAPVIDALET